MSSGKSVFIMNLKREEKLHCIKTGVLRANILYMRIFLIPIDSFQSSQKLKSSFNMLF